MPLSNHTASEKVIILENKLLIHIDRRMSFFIPQAAYMLMFHTRLRLLYYDYYT